MKIPNSILKGLVIRASLATDFRLMATGLFLGKSTKRFFWLLVRSFEPPDLFLSVFLQL